jgi:DNA helicase HerA-like ATPase
VDHDFEKLGALYLGNEVDPASGERTGLLLLDARDLTTHGVIIGMTGSGKTGLGVGLIEEAAIDRIPVIAIDPKGDLGNLLLTFPDLAPADFRPWVNEDVARQRGVDPEAYAAQQAEAWRKGLAASGQDGERIRRLREHADFAVYTPAARPASPSRSSARSTPRRRR